MAIARRFIALLVVRSPLRGAVNRAAQNTRREFDGQNPAELLEFALVFPQLIFNFRSNAFQGIVSFRFGLLEQACGLRLGPPPLGVARGQGLAPQLCQLMLALLA